MPVLRGLHRPEAARPSVSLPAAWLLGAGALLHLGGLVLGAVMGWGARALTLTGFSLLAAGLVALIRQRRDARDRATLVDATAVTTGASLLVWVLVLRPLLAGAEGLALGPALARPVGYLVLAALLARLLVVGRARLVLLAATSLVAPGLLAYQVARGALVDGMAIAVCSVLLHGLVLTRMAGLLRQVERQAAQVRELSRVDELTGLPNRRAWSVELPTALERARRRGGALSVALLDLDHFKRFNDAHGHPAGDRLLRGAAAGWSSQLRMVDQLARYGGEEFILLLPEAPTAFAVQVLERLRPLTPAGQTFSAGVAAWDGEETSEELITRADAALYAAKRSGRNRTVVAAPSVTPSE